MTIQSEAEDWKWAQSGFHGSYLVIAETPSVLEDFSRKFKIIAPSATVRAMETIGELERALTQGSVPASAVFIEQALARRAGAERMQRLADLLQSRPVMLIAGQTTPAYALEAVASGAGAYLTAQASTPVLDHALALAMAREGYATMPPSVLQSRLRQEDETGRNRVLEQLTDRQRDVFELLLNGKSNKEIARDLDVLEGTIKVHVRAIMQKLGVRNRTQVAVVAARNGFLNNQAE